MFFDFGWLASELQFIYLAYKSISTPTTFWKFRLWFVGVSS